MSTEPQIENAVQSIVEQMAGSFMAQRIQGALEILDAATVNEALGAVAIHRPDRFSLYARAKGGDFSEALAHACVKESAKARFLYSHADFVERHLRALIERFEGSACCADKTRSILHELSKFLREGTRIEFNYAGEYTFHLPRRVLTTHEEIEQLFEGLYRLFYGKPDSYFEAYRTVISQVKPDSTSAPDASSNSQG